MTERCQECNFHFSLLCKIFFPWWWLSYRGQIKQREETARKNFRTAQHQRFDIWLGLLVTLLKTLQVATGCDVMERSGCSSVACLCRPVPHCHEARRAPPSVFGARLVQALILGTIQVWCMLRELSRKRECVEVFCFNLQLALGMR